MRAKTVSNPSDGADGNNYALQTVFPRALLIILFNTTGDGKGQREVPLALRTRASFSSSCRSWPNGG